MCVCVCVCVCVLVGGKQRVSAVEATGPSPAREGTPTRAPRHAGGRVEVNLQPPWICEACLKWRD